MTDETTTKTRAIFAALTCLALTACGDDEAGTGSLSVLLEPEDTITAGIEAGDQGESIADGWSVSFDKYIVTIGDIDVHFATDESVGAEAGEVFSVDLAQIETSGLALWSLDGLREGRWEISFATPGAGHGAARHESVADSDFEDMVASDWTYFIDGRLSKADGESCPPAALATVGSQLPTGNSSGDNDCYSAPELRFTFGAAAETLFGPCEIDELPGFAIAADQTQSVALTIHGDHLFFNGFPTGSEGGVMRLAQWWADCDLDLDGTVTAEELEAITLSDLPELDSERYQLGGSPIEIHNMYDYVVAQLKTQGHFQGEGECALDGAAHTH
jgi:hypothetical protein